MSDKRSFVRFARIIPIRFKDCDKDEEGNGKTKDISAKGVGFVTDVALTSDVNLELWLYIPDNYEPLCAQGKVVWSSMIAPKTYRIGIDLTKVDFLGIARILKIKQNDPHQPD